MSMKTNKKGIILLSGGLDSFVSLDMAKKNCEVELALFFNYGQKAYEDEKEAVEKIASYYKIPAKLIELPFLKELSKNALTDNNNNNFNDLESVWIPNRNGLFLNIAACFCDKHNYDYIILGANKEESIEFSDNSVEFIKLSTQFFGLSTQKHPIVLAPLKNYDKIETINYVIDNNLPINFIKSCYKADKEKKHCGDCKSCKLLYNAILKSKKPELIKEIF